VLVEQPQLTEGEGGKDGHGSGELQDNDRRTGSTSRLSSSWPPTQAMADRTWTNRTSVQMLTMLASSSAGRAQTVTTILAGVPPTRREWGRAMAAGRRTGQRRRP
jgi:hypothetical protein